MGLAADQAYAQTYSNSGALKITGFNVDEVPQLSAGTDLNFSVYGSPGGFATLHIAGAQRNLTLSEVDAGLYEGSYTISSRDSITAKSSVTANLRLNNQVVSMILSESLQAGIGYRPPGQTNAIMPKISRFEVQPAADLRRGEEIGFTVHGTPGGKAEMAIAGVKGTIFLQESKSGEYTGTYTIKKRDRIESSSPVTATLRHGERIATATLNKPLMSAAAQPRRKTAICSACGTVEAINIVEVKGDGNYLGTIGGGIIGAALGNQVGGGNGKTIATIAGAIGGAFAGRAIEGQVKKTTHHEVLVRLQNGGTQTASFESDPGYRIGDKVRITDGILTRDL
jgi:outer membrane lipoprotein SlyB